MVLYIDDYLFVLLITNIVAYVTDIVMCTTKFVGLYGLYYVIRNMATNDVGLLMLGLNVNNRVLSFRVILSSITNRLTLTQLYKSLHFPIKSTLLHHHITNKAHTLTNNVIHEM